MKFVLNTPTIHDPRSGAKQEMAWHSYGYIYDRLRYPVEGHTGTTFDDLCMEIWKTGYADVSQKTAQDIAYGLIRLLDTDLVKAI